MYLEPTVLPTRGYTPHCLYIVFLCLSWNSICCWLLGWLIIKDHLIENYRVMLYENLLRPCCVTSYELLLCDGHQGALFVWKVIFKAVINNFCVTLARPKNTNKKNTFPHTYQQIQINTVSMPSHICFDVCQMENE